MEDLVDLRADIHENSLSKHTGALAHASKKKDFLMLKSAKTLSSGVIKRLGEIKEKHLEILEFLLKDQKSISNQDGIWSLILRKHQS
jgi:hypothetical protein